MNPPTSLKRVTGISGMCVICGVKGMHGWHDAELALFSSEGPRKMRTRKGDTRTMPLGLLCNDCAFRVEHIDRLLQATRLARPTAEWPPATGRWGI